MSTRELPDDQQCIDEDERKDDIEIQTMERAEELSSQFEAIKDRTVDDNVVLGQLKDINTSENSNTIVVSIDLPGEGMDKEKRFKKPKVWSDRYKFVRWIRHYDYDADSFPNMLEDKCKVKVLRDGNREYEVFVPEKKRTIGESVHNLITAPITWVKVPVSLYHSLDIPLIAVVATIGHSVYTIALFTQIVDSGMNAWPTLGMVVIVYIVISIVGFLESVYLETRD